MPSFSHQCVYQPIWKELSLRGHSVTVLTPNPLNDPSLTNLTEIDMSFVYKIMDGYRKSGKQPPTSISNFKNVLIVHKIISKVIEFQLQSDVFQNFLNNRNQTYDVVVVEFLNPTMLALSAKFDCPMIGILSLPAFMNGNVAVGNTVHPVVTPDVQIPLISPLSFPDRVYSTIFHIWFRYFYYRVFLPTQDAMAKKYIGKDLPYLGEIEKNVSILMLNSNPILNFVRPNVAAVIEFDKVCLKPRRPLPGVSYTPRKN